MLFQTETLPVCKNLLQPVKNIFVANEFIELLSVAICVHLPKGRDKLWPNKKTLVNCFLRGHFPGDPAF